MTTIMHPEEVKSAIRKRHGTVANFVKNEGLPRYAVTDFLRGRGASAATKAALQRVIGETAVESMKLDTSRGAKGPHRKIAGGK